MNAFFKVLLNCFPLIWMCCHRSLKHKINRLRERSLRSIYSDSFKNQKYSFDDLVALDGSVSVDNQHIQRSGTTIFGTSESLK